MGGGGGGVAAPCPSLLLVVVPIVRVLSVVPLSPLGGCGKLTLPSFVGAGCRLLPFGADVRFFFGSSL